jgi:hypothetical protein
MVSWLVILVIAISVLALGSAVVLQFLPRRAWLSLEGIFSSIILGVVLGGWLALVLAELGYFSMISLLLLWLLIFTTLLILAYNRRRVTAERYYLSETDSQISLQQEQTAGDKLFFVLLALWLVIATWLFFRPHEYILGGADAGVYVSLGAEIAQNGGFVLQDQTLAQLDTSLSEVFLRPLPANPVADSYLFPGFYVIDAAAGAVTPQFYPFHPSWLAIAFGLSDSPVAGVQAELLLNGLWMMLASVAVILTAREVGGWLAAVLLMVGLSVCALQVWFGRYPTTEALTQFLLWSGLWSMVGWLGCKKPASLWALVSGSAMGAVFLVRIDILVLLPALAFLIISLWLRGWQKSDWWFVLPLSLMVMHSLVHGAVLSAPYFSEHFGYGLRLLWAYWWLTGLLVAAGLLSLWVLYRFRRHYRDLSRYRMSFVLISIAAFLTYAIYGWFIRPVILEASLRPDFYSETLLLITNHENWRRLAWYLSIPGIWLGVAGICLLIWKIERKTILLVVIGVLFLVIYLWNVRANPHQIYVMRRYVPAVAPFFLLAGAYFISQIPGFFSSRPNGRLVEIFLTVLIGAIWLGQLAWSARGFIRQVDNAGVSNQLAVINEDFPPQSVLLFNDQSPVSLGDFWGTPLKYVFGHDVFTIRDTDLLQQASLVETIEFWQNSGRTVIWFGNPQWLSEQGLEYQTTIYTINSRQMESSYLHKPQQINPVSWQLEAAFLVSNPRSS